MENLNPYQSLMLTGMIILYAIATFVDYVCSLFTGLANFLF